MWRAHAQMRKHTHTLTRTRLHAHAHAQTPTSHTGNLWSPSAAVPLHPTATRPAPPPIARAAPQCATTNTCALCQWPQRLQALQLRSPATATHPPTYPPVHAALQLRVHGSIRGAGSRAPQGDTSPARAPAPAAWGRQGQARAGGHGRHEAPLPPPLLLRAAPQEGHHGPQLGLREGEGEGEGRWNRAGKVAGGGWRWQELETVREGGGYLTGNPDILMQQPRKAGPQCHSGLKANLT